MLAEKRLLVVYEGCSPEQALREIDANSNWQWVYAGRDFLCSLRWEETFRETARRLSIAAQLQSTADDLALEFNTLIDELGKDNSSIGWWIGKISEKNAYISDLFLYICYLKSITEAMSTSQEENWIVVTDSAGLARTLVAHARRSGWRSGWIMMWRARAMMLLRAGTEIYSEFRMKIAMLFSFASLHRLMMRLDAGVDDTRGDQKHILIHSWLRNDSLDQEGKFVDRFFDVLPQELQERGYNVQYLVLPPTNFAARNVVVTILEKLSEQGLLFPSHKYLGWPDFLKAFFLPYVTSNLPKGRSWLGGLNVSALISEERWSQVWSSRTSLIFTYYLFSRRLGIKGKSFDRIIHTFENHNWEKAFCLGIHKYTVSDRVVGFQHTAILWNYHVYCPGSFERRAMVLPDVVVANGKFWANKLHERGFPNVVVGGAFRFKHLFALPSRKQINADRVVILAAASASVSQTLEMMRYLYLAFGDDSSSDVCIKLHPIHSVTDAMCMEIFEDKQPAHFRYVDEPITQLLSCVDVLIYCSTTMCLEALAHGVPSISITPATSIDMDVMRWFPSIRRSADSPQMLREQVKYILGMSEEEKTSWVREAKEIVDQVFAPVTDRSIDAFLR